MIETSRLLLYRSTNDDMLIIENLLRDGKVRKYLGGIISDDLIKKKITVFKRSYKSIFLLLSLVLIFSNNCQAEHLKNLNSLKKLKFTTDTIQVTAPYSILENTKYTPNLDVMQFEQYSIKIVDRKDPENLVLDLTAKNETLEKHENLTQASIEKRLPWWSKSVPNELKSLDFSRVDGTLNEYKIGNHYRLKLLSKQGAWGKVYALEYGPNSSIICAVKVLLTKQDSDKDVNWFRQRHIDEIKNNFIISDRNIDISSKPYGMLKNDDDHYLVFLEYGQNAYAIFKNQSKEQSTDALYDLVFNINKLHLAGYAHGDLNVRNMLFIDNKIKLCDWYSLVDFKEINLKDYRYIGDNMPPEAARAHYFGNNGILLYSLVIDKNQKQSYILHPISADRFCLGISLLEIIAPDLYKQHDTLMSANGFNPWKPSSLDFWKHHVAYINNTQAELLKRADKIDNWKLAQLHRQAAQFISLDPMARILIPEKNFKR